MRKMNEQFRIMSLDGGFVANNPTLFAIADALNTG